MMILYNFTNIQKKQVEDLLSEKFSMMWSSVIFGTPIGSSDMVQIALSQVGNIGGEIYWRWYGFNSRVEWCAVFVMWLAKLGSERIDEVFNPSLGIQRLIDLYRSKGYDELWISK